MLLPAKAEVVRHLSRYRAWERVMLASPADPVVRHRFEDSGYSLCALMGKRCAREAADAADRYLRSGLVSYLREERREAPPLLRGRRASGRTGRRGPPGGRRSPAGR
ncbi:DUF5133 domain-containing protein [Streptomyces abyssomicinicus]|uniref:DUF5133 domain-containing protein n=1 Tax=Streptomyces abyssomicinicus TaxID=574929 RepID=UPI0012503FC6|nr:DUF5133 domain-containing protein [Streptomyces abyssomicinicus]